MFKLILKKTHFGRMIKTSQSAPNFPSKAGSNIIESSSSSIKSTHPSEIRALSTYPPNTSVKIKYDDFLKEFVSGQSLIDSTSLQKILNKNLAKKFGSQDLEEIKKKRQEMLEKRGEKGLMDQYFKNNEKDIRKVFEDSETQTGTIKDTKSKNYEIEREFGQQDVGVTPFRDLNNKYAMDLSEEFGMSFEDAKNHVKKEYFFKKKDEEENARFELNKKKWEKKKEIKKLVEYVKKNDLEEKGLFTTTKPDNFDALEAEPQDSTVYLKPYTVFRIRTLKNIQRFIEDFFHNQHAKLTTWLQGNYVSLDEIIIGENIYSISVFWTFSQNRDNSEKNKGYVNGQLNKYSPVLGGIMCQKLGLRMAPKIRFFPSQTVDEMQKTIDDIASDLPEMLKEDVLEETKITDEEINKSKEKKEFVDRKIKEKEIIFYSNLEEMTSNQAWLKEAGKAYSEQNPEKIGKKEKNRERHNRNEDGSRKKYSKKNRVDLLWNDIMK